MRSGIFTFFLLLGLSFTSFAQKPDTAFQKEWLAIDTLIVKSDLTRTALTKVNVIYQKAKQKQLHGQIIKALIYRYSLEDRITSNDPNQTFNTIHAEIAASTDEIQKAILYSLLAKSYKQYYYDHRYELFGRKNTVQLNKEDITTWSTDDFIAAISSSYFRSLREKNRLQQQKIEPFDAVVLIGNSRKLRPTLYDLLAHEALEYFMSGEINVPKPINTFIIDNVNALGTIDIFINTKFLTKDSSSQQWISLHLFQQLLSFHRNDANKDVLLDINLMRIEWVYANAVFANKENTYIKALQEITTQYASAPVTAQAWYLLARNEANKAASYQPSGDTSNRYGYAKAKQLLEKALPLFSESNTGTVNMRNLLLEINTKNLHSQTEKVNVPGKPFRALVQYRNVDTLYGRIIKLDKEIADRYSNDFWTKVTGMKASKTFIQPLPKVNDHQLHSVEIKIDGLPFGEYIFLSSNSSSFDNSKDKMSAQFFHVSNISYVKNKNDFFVLNRDNGKPMPNVKVIILKQQYISRLQKNIDDTVSSKVTDKNGHFRFVPNGNNFNFRYVFTTADDKLFLKENDYNYIDNNPETEELNETAGNSFETKSNRMFFFTDRSIYRPGQTVFFKGIAVTRDYKTKLSKLVTRKDSGWAYLKDANRKIIDSIMFALNNYGSFTGRFRLPQNTLTGAFSIEAKKYQSGSYFKVEEYKRPTFSVSFEKVKGSYRLNDTIVINGSAKALAGNNINGAKVSFHITRNIRFRDIWRKPYLLPTYKEISYGELVTDTEGKFTIKFKADADDVTDRTGNPLFDFSIRADVTDIAGETRSSATSVTTGFSSLLLKINTPLITETDSLKKITILATNLSNEKQVADIQVKVYPLQAPARIIRSRYWQKPDQFIFSEEEFLHYFPTDEYNNESNYVNWPAATAVLEGNLNTAKQDAYMIPAGSLGAGYYKIEAITKDKYGEDVKQVQYIQLFSRKNDQLPAPAYRFAYTVNNTVEPLQSASFLTGSSVNNLFVISKTETNRQKNTAYDYQYRKAGIRTIQYTPTENDRGGVDIGEVYVFDNRIYTNQYHIYVPWNNKKLEVSYETYRDKTEPGSIEKWTVSLQGNKSEKLAAELLTGMYDASLDQFSPHNWAIPSLWPNYISSSSFAGSNNFIAEMGNENPVSPRYIEQKQVEYDRLALTAADLIERDLRKWTNDPVLLSYASIYQQNHQRASVEYVKTRPSKGRTIDASVANLSELQSKSGVATTEGMSPPAQETIADKVFTSVDYIDPVTGDHIVNGRITEKGNTGQNIMIRRNFNETAFFFPQLYADSTGKYSFTFTMPEVVTQWKWMSLAHTKDLAFGSYSIHIITQKKLMVQPNAPRFLREGDNMEFSSRLVNLSDKEITGRVIFELIDATDNTPVDKLFRNISSAQNFTVASGQNIAIKFPIQIPFGYNRLVTWRIKAVSGDFSDGEENVLPVLTNRVLVTESLPLFLPNDTTRHYLFNKLLNNKSESLTHEAVTVEYTSNPIWYAVQALPYLMEYPYECTEQTFNRLYANALASYIVNKYPKIKQVFEQWKKDSVSLKSTLQKNEALKQILLQETPWIIQAENEEQQKKNIGLLFDLVKLSDQTDVLIEKLSQMQLPDGSFPWFKGGNTDRYMTNYILTGIGKLKRLGAISPEAASRIRIVLVRALQYMDDKIVEDYNRLIKNKADLDKQHISPVHIDYLYMRSFFRDIARQSQKEYDYFFNQGKKFWTMQNSYYKAQLGLIYYRNSEEKFATGTILPALLENAINDPEQGMYWKNAYTGFWYQSPIEHQSMLIALLSELNQDQKDPTQARNINAMKTWLLLNKQTTNWRTTIATADACYALLLNGSDWLNADKQVSIQLGKTVINNGAEKVEAATGYFKKSLEGKQVTTDMGNIPVSVNSKNTRLPGAKTETTPSWGNIYWQYFEDLDKITPAATPLSLNKKIFVERNTDKGKMLDPVKEGDVLKTGDKIIVRMELRSDRDMDYLHLKDMRAAAMEPVNVLSGYKWQDGIGYYESTKDASTNFFIDHLRKGTYVFDYPLFITHTGLFSVGIATIQCMYAPEFTSHSEGIKIKVAK
jgi:hypothetical protein